MPYFTEHGYDIDKDRLRKIMWDESDIFVRNNDGWGQSRGLTSSDRRPVA